MEWTSEELKQLSSKDALLAMLAGKEVDVGKLLKDLAYQEELEQLQIELVKLQRWVQEHGKRIAIIFEGRDAAGKGGAILRFSQHLSPRAMRIVALPKPTEVEKGQWYFQRYAKHLPSQGEIVFFDRSWYNRAVVEPVNGFCTPEEHKRFLRQAPEFERLLLEDGIILFKLWFEISKEEQAERLAERRKTPLKQWKISPVDEKAQQLWPQYTKYKDKMLAKTHTPHSPWVIVKANGKRKARLESIRYVLHAIEYEGKEKASVSLVPNQDIIKHYQPS